MNRTQLNPIPVTQPQVTSLSLFRTALEVAIAARYADWLRLFSGFRNLIQQKENSLSHFDKRLVRWVETKGRTLGFEEKDRRSTMKDFSAPLRDINALNREELLFHFLDTLDNWSAKVGHLLIADQQAAHSLRNDALARLKQLEWADVATIRNLIERTQADVDRLGEVERERDFSNRFS